VAAKHSGTFPQVAMLQIDKDFGGWGKAQKKYFDDGGVFDSIYSGIGRR
jgi:sulfate transport system substrate-binding protein